MTFGILTAQQHVDYADLLRIWQQADQFPQIGHAWLFDHLLSIGDDGRGSVFEGWTLLAALAAQTTRLRLGILVSANRARPPAVLAKIATTVDVISGGRLEFGIGVGSRPQPPEARREYPAHGLPYDISFTRAVASLDEACTIIRRLWNASEPFDYNGQHHQLTAAFGNPKPVQHPHPPITIAGRADATLRVVAQHADIWNIPGGNLEDCVERNTRLDQLCTDIGRDLAAITRSIVLPFHVDRPLANDDAIRAVRDAGFTRIMFGLGTPFPDGVIEQIANTIHRATD